jgi:hypothetical protein
VILLLLHSFPVQLSHRHHCTQPFSPFPSHHTIASMN